MGLLQKSPIHLDHLFIWNFLFPNYTIMPRSNKNKVTLKEIRETYYSLRNFEISNLWQRSVFLSAILVLFYSGYGYLVSKSLDEEVKNPLLLHELCCAIALLAIVFRSYGSWWQKVPRHGTKFMRIRFSILKTVRIKDSRMPPNETKRHSTGIRPMPLFKP